MKRKILWTLCQVGLLDALIVAILYLMSLSASLIAIGLVVGVAVVAETGLANLFYGRLPDG